MAYAEKSPHRPSFWFKNDQDDFEDLQLQLQQQQQQQTLPLPSAVVTPPPPSFAGIPLKYISLLTLAIQNAALAVLMHYSRVSAQPSHTYSAASAVLATELLKGAISLAIAFTRIDVPPWRSPEDTSLFCRSAFYPPNFFARCRLLGKEVFRPDCWKLSIPAILYVIQNNLQFVAASNLDAATFQVSYQMKILTTAAFSVVLLRKKLTPLKWFSLFFLAVGVGVVQLQTSSRSHGGDASYALAPLKGFLAVAAACFTSGLAGVYFEMVLKNSSGDLWVRNVQLSLFSLLPALAPIVFSGQRPSGAVPSFNSLFANFTVAAWATVGTQVLGGLITALVIKYADNIMKGFATSLSIVISFLLSVAIFHVQITLAFLVGAAIVLVATWLYSQPDNTSCAGRRGLRCDKTADQPPLLPFSSAIALAPHPQPFRPAPITVPPMLSQLGRRTPGGSPYSSPTSPAPEYRNISTTHVYSPHHSPTRSLSMPSIVLSPPSPADGFANAHHAPSIHHFTAPPTPEG